MGLLNSLVRRGGVRPWLTTPRPEITAVSAGLTSFLATTSASSSDVPRSLEGELTALCADYLLHAKRDDREPVDPVPRFHLANGASLERINWMGDESVSGIRRSFGLTANYVYRLKQLERNHEAYAHEFRVVATPTLARLAGRRRRPRR